MIADQGVRNARLLLPVAILLATACGAGGEHDEQVVWALVEEPVGTTYELGAAFGGSSCTEFREWEVEEGSTEVEVRAIVTFSGEADCTADLVYEPYTLRLATPLGQRELLGCDPDDDDRDCTQVVPPSGT